MRTIRLILVLAGLGTGLLLGDLRLTCLQLRGDEARLVATGRVLILDNDRALEGDIERRGDNFRVAKGGGELWLPAAKTVRLCAGWDEALAYMKSRANLQDADERLRLARWCRVHGLLEQGLGEVKAALEMRPEHRASRQLQVLLEKDLEARKLPPGRAPTQAAAPPPALDVGVESLALFNARVQPILLNTCASCHATDKGGEFRLSRPFDGGHRAATQRNLAAVLEHIHFERPVLSPLLIKAVSAHGHIDQAPIQGRQSVPYKTLEQWVRMVVANNPHLNNPHLKEQRSPTTVASKIAARQITPPELDAADRDGVEPANVRTIPLVPSTSGPSQVKEPARAVPGQPNLLPPLPSSPANPAAQRSPSAGAGDPFDPAEFNRKYQPKR